MMLVGFHVARVAADPAVVPAVASPGGWDGLAYYRVHGSPTMYYSPYPPDVLATLAARLVAHAESGPVWCVLDNTALGAATANALDVVHYGALFASARLRSSGGGSLLR
jgi:uncharacterized protein YecE (DUF72 family)